MVEREFKRLRIEKIQSAAMPAKAGIVCWFLFLVLSAIANPVFAQWKPLYTRPYCYITKIYFLELPEESHIGFAIGSDVLKTTDGGNTWRKIPLDPSITEESGLYDITFKDSLTGWISVGGTYTSSQSHQPGGCIKTTDGGETWSSILPESESIGLAIYYNKKSDGLFLSTRIGPSGGYNLVSWDEGATWQNQTSNNDLAYGRCAFSNDDTGVMVQFDGILQPWYRTTDAGQTWNPIAMDTPCYTAIAIPGTETYYANVGTGDLQHEGIILRTDDSWNTWRIVYQFPSMQVPYSGWNPIVSSFAITGDSNNLIVQYGPGIYHSTDGGTSWNFLCGPGWADEGFPSIECYTKDNEIFCVTDDSALDVTIWKLDLDSLNAVTTNYSEQFGDGLGQDLSYTGDTVRVDYFSDTAMGDAIGTDSVSISISFDTNVLSLAHFELPPGWSIKDSSFSNGTYHLLLVNSDSLALDSSARILRADFVSHLSATSSKVYLDSVHYYGHRLNCDCAVASVSGPDSVQINFTGCGDSILLAAMNDSLAFVIESIQPNPAQHEITVTLSGSVQPSVEMYDALGRVVALPTTPQPPPIPLRSIGGGVVLDVSNVPSGLYFLRFSNDGYALSRQVVIQH
jgi:photosystem II stability/assembly factor-like uncharacterized protein